MDWIYERLNKLVKNGEMTEEEARQEYKAYKAEQVKQWITIIGCAVKSFQL